MPGERPFFVIGQWSGPHLKVWDVREAPDDPEELAAAHEELGLDAEEAFGSVEIVHAASAKEAEATARREAAETAERISQDMTRQRERRSNATPRRRRTIPHHYT
ncbi:hypothetical protein ABZU45_40545 [Streptomyces avermitilis]|uniref:hypothetical protein n=1 Tax=Streptomyces avermitilis TaxID=33903 RepID=UPI00339F1612